jgi:hypothetical protein
MVPDTAAERSYLEALAFKLKLPTGLVEEIHRTAGHTPPTPSTTTGSEAYVPANSV